LIKDEFTSVVIAVSKKEDDTQAHIGVWLQSGVRNSEFFYLDKTKCS
jgi:hypothetical protein